MHSPAFAIVLMAGKSGQTCHGIAYGGNGGRFQSVAMSNVAKRPNAQTAAYQRQDHGRNSTR